MKIKSFPLRTLQIVSVISLSLLIFGCKSNSGKQGDGKDSLEVGDDLKTEITKAKQMMWSLPSPIETAMLIKRAGAKYNEEFLNPLENVSKYTTNKSMALNLGIYSADLSFASMFDQPQASIKYLSTCKKLADDLGILNAIDKSLIDRMDANVNNRDSLMTIISESLMNSNSFLKENDRAETAAIILVGGWIEGLYIATKIAKTSTSNKELIDRIVDQRLSLNILLNMLEDYKEGNQAETVKELVGQLTEINSVFEKIQISTTKIEPQINQNTKTTTLNSKTKIVITPEVFEQLCTVVEKFRNGIIK